MSGPKAARGSLVVAVLAMLLGVTGCTAPAGGLEEATLSEQDTAAIGQLAKIATRDALPEGPVSATECWAPSQNPVLGDLGSGGGESFGEPDGETAETGEKGNAVAGLVDSAADPENGFRVICRVHFEQQGGARYRDMICIGDLGSDPVAEYCYQWAYYANAPKFEDRPAFVVPVAR